MKQLAVMLYLSLRGKSEDQDQPAEETGLFSPFLHAKHEKLSAKMAEHSLKETHGFSDLFVFVLVIGINLAYKVYLRNPSTRVKFQPWKRFFELIQV